MILGPPRVDGRPLTDYGDWLGTVGADRLTRGSALRFHVTLTNEFDTYLRPRQPQTACRSPRSSRRSWPPSPARTACSA